MEYNYAVGVLARERGLGNIFVTNGTMTADVARFAAESFLDAANVDLKAMKGSTYRKHCKAGAQGLETVLDCISALHKAGVWVEVTTLIIPGLNDDDDELRDAARFLVGVSPDIPWHLSRYHPDFRWLSSPPTPVATLRRAHALGREEGLNYVYTGNIWGDDREHTTCPNCQGVLLRRRGFTVDVTGFRGDGSGTCAHCGFHVAGVQLP
jgi:pyruvate formate lyase activating enzyme